MKFHLPKQLLVAVLAAMSVQYASAADYVISGADESATVSDIIASNGSAVTIRLEAGNLTVDADVADLQASGGVVNVVSDAEISGNVSGDCALSVTGGESVLNGANSYTGKTEISNKGTKVTLGSDTALGKSSVYLSGNAKLDFNHYAVDNSIYVNAYSGSTVYLYNADAYTGDMDVRGSLNIGVNAKANKITVSNQAATSQTIISNKNSSITVNEFEVQTGLCMIGLNGVISTDLTVAEQGKVTLNKDAKLDVKGKLSINTKGTLTLNSVGTSDDFIVQAKTFDMASGASFVLNCDGSPTTTLIQTETATLSDNLSVVINLGDAWSAEELNITLLSSSSAATGGDKVAVTINSLFWEVVDSKWIAEPSKSAENAYSEYRISASLTKKEKVNIKDQEVVLGDGNALGDGPISTEGDTTLSTGENVTVQLPDVIENKGNLTMSGSYDGSELKEINTADTCVSVDGEEGNNGFFREGGTALVVVDNKGEATLTVDGQTTVTNKTGEELKLYASGLAAGELDYSKYHIEASDHEAAMSKIQAMRPNTDEPLTISLNKGTLVADADAADVQSTGGTIATVGNVSVGGNLAGTTEVVVGEGTTTLSGENSYTGDTTISGENSKLVVGEDKALGASKVQLHNKGTLDLNHKAVSNYINVTGCELHNASAYTGSMDVSGNLTICGSDATANVVNMVNGGSIAASANEKLTVNSVTVSGGNSTIDADLVINPDGSIVLNNGSKLDVRRSLTLGNGATIVLNGGEYSKGDVLLTSASTTAPASGVAVLSYGYGSYVLNGNDIILTAVFNQNIANACTVSNWGIATASRAVVNAVRGQRSNTGCIADGKGTAWVALLGGNNDINGSDIKLSGSAVGADMQVGAASRLGVAMGYVEGEVRPSGLRQVDQEGSYIAAYGEHGLKKLSPTSCLSMDWVAAYGNTDSKAAGLKWEQDSVQLNSRVNWNKKVNDRLCMSVFGGLEYFASNSGTVEGVKTGSIQNLRGEIGAGARYVAWGTPAVKTGKSGLVPANGCEKLVLHGEIRYMNDMVRSNPVIRMDGLSGMGENPGRQGMGIEAGATYRIGERWSASANYGFNTMEDSREHRLNVGASYTF